MEITPNSNQDRIKNQYEVGEQVQTEAKWKSTAIFGGLFILSDIKWRANKRRAFIGQR